MSSVSESEDRDTNFDRDCINLLCQLESIADDLAEHSRRQRTSQCLESAKEMLVAFLDFSETRFDESDEPILAELRSVYQATKELEQLVEKEAWGSWKSYFGVRQEASFEVQRRYAELGGQYGELFREFFGRCQTRIGATDTRKQFDHSVEHFVLELADRW